MEKDRAEIKKENQEMKETLKKMNENLQLERDLHIRTREAYESKFDHIDTTVKQIMCKIDNVKVINDQIQKETRAQHTEVGRSLERMESHFEINTTNNTFSSLFREPNLPNPTPPNPTPPNPLPPTATQTPKTASVTTKTMASRSPSTTTRTAPVVTTTTASSLAHSSARSPPRPNGDSSKDKRTKKPKLLLITDSNGRPLNMKQLKPESEGCKFERFTTKLALDDIPRVSEPEEVTDIVFQVGLNDLRNGLCPKEIQENILDLQLAYNQQFPNARQHITAVPPLEDKHDNLNSQLQKLSKFTESNFISTKDFKDRATGKICSNVMNDYHYKAVGSKILAKAIMKSLYSTSNIKPTRLARMSQIRRHSEMQNPQIQNTE